MVTIITFRSALSEPDHGFDSKQYMARAGHMPGSSMDVLVMSKLQAASGLSRSNF